MTEIDPSPDPQAPPPKSLVRQVRYLRHVTEELNPEVLAAEGFEVTEGNGKALRLRGSAGIEQTPKSLPVLRAFQDFLESERRRTRSRMLYLTAFFAAVLLAVVAVGVFLAIAFMDRVRDEMTEIQANAVQAREAAGRAGDEARAAAAGEAARLRTDLDRERAEIARAADEAESVFAAYTNRLGYISSVVEMLQLQNAALKGDMEEIRKGRSAPAAPAETAAAPEAPEGFLDALPLTITPRGSDRPVRWLLPLPR